MSVPPNVNGAYLYYTNTVLVFRIFHANAVSSKCLYSFYCQLFNGHIIVEYARTRDTLAQCAWLFGRCIGHLVNKQIRARERRMQTASARINGMPVSRVRRTDNLFGFAGSLRCEAHHPCEPCVGNINSNPSEQNNCLAVAGTTGGIHLSVVA